MSTVVVVQGGGYGAPAAPIVARSPILLAAAGLQFLVSGLYWGGAFGGWVNLTVTGISLPATIGLIATTSYLGPLLVSVPVATFFASSPYGTSLGAVNFALAMFIIGAIATLVAFGVGICTCCCKGTRTALPSAIASIIALVCGLCGVAAGGSQMALVLKGIPTGPGLTVSWGPGFALGLTGLLLNGITTVLYVVDLVQSKGSAPGGALKGSSTVVVGGGSAPAPYMPQQNPMQVVQQPQQQQAYVQPQPQQAFVQPQQQVVAAAAAAAPVGGDTKWMRHGEGTEMYYESLADGHTEWEMPPGGVCVN